MGRVSPKGHDEYQGGYDDQEKTEGDPSSHDMTPDLCSEGTIAARARRTRVLRSDPMTTPRPYPFLGGVEPPVALYDRQGAVTMPAS